jgi:hypothetical protein
MNLQVLAAKIREPQYAGLSDQLLADAINGLRVSVRCPVPTYLVRRQACEGLYWSDLIDACESSDVMLKKLARAMMIWINDTSGTVQTIDMDLPAVVFVMGSLVSLGVITQAQADALSALADASIPWTESVGLPEIGVGLIVNARRLANG